MRMCIYIYMHTYTQTHIYAYTHICTCTLHAYMHTHIHIRVHAHLYTGRKSQEWSLNASNNIIDAHTHPYTYACIYTSICIDWCRFYYFVINSLVALLEALCAWIISWNSWISVFSDIFFCVYARSLTKPFSRPSQPGSCAWLSPFLLCADCTCVHVCVCFCMCMWKCVGKGINI